MNFTEASQLDVPNHSTKNRYKTILPSERTHTHTHTSWLTRKWLKWCCPALFSHAHTQTHTHIHTQLNNRFFLSVQFVLKLPD